MSAPLAVGVVLMGGTMLLLQIVLTRELLASFSGNELSIALILVAWLLLVGAGSALGGRAARHRRLGLRAFAFLQLALLVPLPLSVLAAQAAGGVPRLPGQVLGPLPMLGLSAGVLALPCLLLGAQFALACALAGGGGAAPSTQVTWVYVLEAAGSVAGGVLFHLYLADHLSPLAVALGLGAANCAAATMVGVAVARPQGRTLTATAAVVGVVALGMLAGVLVCPRYADVALTWRWRGLGLAETVNSRYGSIAVTRRAGQVTIYENGTPAVTTGLVAETESAAHLPLLEHPHPRRVLVIAGGLGGLLREVLKHPVERVDYVELDPALVSVARRYLQADLSGVPGDPRVSVHIEDGRRFVKAARGPYDVVMLNLPEPTTVLLNRYYTAEFQREVARVLAPGGVFTFALPTPHLQLYGERQLLHSVLHAQLREQFADTLVLPGSETRTIACARRGVLTTDPQVLVARLRQRGIGTGLLTPFAIEDALSPFRREMFERSLRPPPGRPPPHNLDFRPLCAFLALSLWTRQYGQGGAALLGTVGRALPYAVALPAMVALGLLVWRPRGPLGRGSLLAIMATAGLLGMGAQVLILLGFQAVSGYLFREIGLLLTLFMAGLAAGAVLVRRSGSAGLLLATQAALLLVCVFVVPFVLQAAAAGPQRATWLLGLLSAGVGVLVGASFPLVLARVALDQPRAAAGLYAADLAGAAAGGLLVGTLAMPLQGLRGTALLLGALAAASALLAARGCLSGAAGGGAGESVAEPPLAALGSPGLP